MAISLRGVYGKALQELKDELERARLAYWEYLKDTEIDGSKAQHLEKVIEVAEYKLWCEQYEDNRRRTWK